MTPRMELRKALRALYPSDAQLKLVISHYNELIDGLLLLGERYAIVIADLRSKLNMYEEFGRNRDNPGQFIHNGELLDDSES